VRERERERERDRDEWMGGGREGDRARGSRVRVFGSRLEECGRRQLGSGRDRYRHLIIATRPASM
jgi:hypothetical protein